MLAGAIEFFQGTITPVCMLRFLLCFVLEIVILLFSVFIVLSHNNRTISSGALCTILQESFANSRLLRRQKESFLGLITYLYFTLGCNTVYLAELQAQLIVREFGKVLIHYNFSRNSVGVNAKILLFLKSLTFLVMILSA